MHAFVHFAYYDTTPGSTGIPSFYLFASCSLFAHLEPVLCMEFMSAGHTPQILLHRMPSRIFFNENSKVGGYHNYILIVFQQLVHQS
jgi:hypothetical protein